MNRTEGQSADRMRLPLERFGEYFAAGYFEDPAAPPIRRWARATRRRWEHQTLAPYNGERLYPCGARFPGNENQIVMPDFSYTYVFNDAAWLNKRTWASQEEREVLDVLKQEMTNEWNRVHVLKTPHLVGGAGFTHSIPHYGRVLREGLNAYAGRIETHLDKARESHDLRRIDFYFALQDVLEGIRAWHRRIIEDVGKRPPNNTEAIGWWKVLMHALDRVPFEPARSFFEAMLAYNIVFYLDDCDDPGRLDQELFPYYAQDARKVGLTRNEARALLRQFNENVTANLGWSAAIGGTMPDGAPGYNELTEVCLEAVHGLPRPNYQLRVRDDMPDAVWDAAFDALATGCGQPALYNEEGFLDSLRAMDLGVSEEDLVWWNGGGCTETMIHGRSNVGSLDAGLHLPLVFESTLHKHLAAARTFEEFVAQLKEDIAAAVQEIVENLNRYHRLRAEWRPQPMRSLLIDDCIDRGLDFTAGGARYNWSVVNVAGLANVADSLAAVREVVFEKQEQTGAELIEILRNNFEGEETFRRRVGRCPRFGNDDPRVDDLAAEVAEVAFREFLKHTPWRGGRFLPSCIMFETFGPEGKRLGATPDGRRAGEPLADSIGPYQGRDVHGPTAMLHSVTRLPLHLAVGTPILNIRFTKDLFATPSSRRRLRELIRTYFRMGGMQIQVSVLDQEALRDALAHPEKHENLIVRIGGYSTYFNRLSPELKQAVLDRIAHAV